MASSFLVVLIASWIQSVCHGDLADSNSEGQKWKALNDSFELVHQLTSKHSDYLQALAACTKPGCPSLGRRPRLRTEKPVEKSVRKDIRVMTDDERHRLFAVLQTLKTRMPPNVTDLSEFDIFVSYHSPTKSRKAHFDAAFLPFHREYLNNLENAMRLVDSRVSLPVWDSTLDSTLPNPSDSILWTDQFLGNDQGNVTSGPLANWTSVSYKDSKGNLIPQRKIFRTVGLGGRPVQNENVKKILELPDYQSLVNCKSDPYIEYVHNGVHGFVGGGMGSLVLAPNDIVFWMHHAFIDQIWEMWRQKNQVYAEREKSFYVEPKYKPAEVDPCPESEANPDDPLLPFTSKNVSDGLSNSYTDTFYTYQPQAMCADSCNGSPYLFCDKANDRCMSKIRPEGNCEGYDGQDICYKSTCTGGKCVSDTTTTTTTASSAAKQNVIE